MLTAIVCGAHHLHPPRERGVQVKLHRGVVQESPAGLAGIRGEHGIVQARTRVVGVDVEVVVDILVCIGGFEVEVLRGGLCRVVGPGDEGSGRGDGGEESEGGEEVHAAEMDVQRITENTSQRERERRMRMKNEE